MNPVDCLALFFSLVVRCAVASCVFALHGAEAKCRNHKFSTRALFYRAPPVFLLARVRFVAVRCVCYQLLDSAFS